MAAGLGFKDFTTGEVLTAADVDGYLMQGIWVFTNATARDAAVTSPQEGNFAFTKDNNSLWYYDGAAWVASGATGDIEGVTAGIGISGGGTSGTVTVTNSMATAIDAKGDLVPGTGADTFAKLTVGANGTVLTADSAEATGLKWATPAGGGGYTLLSTTTLSGTSVTISSINQTYKHLFMIGNLISVTSGGENVGLRLNGDTGSNYQDSYFYFITSNHGAGSDNTSSPVLCGYNATTPAYNANNNFNTWIYRYTETETKIIQNIGFASNNAEKRYAQIGFNSTSAITSITIRTNGGHTFNNGTVYLYGVN
jgi:hypothetical protein